MSLLSRRELAIALAAIPAVGFAQQAGRPTSKPNSTWAGVTVGMNVPYNFGTRTAMSAEETLVKCVEVGVSSTELRAQAIEKSLGLPDDMVLGFWRPTPAAQPTAAAPAPQSSGNPGGVAYALPSTPEELAAYEAKAANLRTWRLTSGALQRASALRATYERAGVGIDIIKFDGFSDYTDAELDYACKLTRALGARAISAELEVPYVPHLAKAADRNKMPISLHNHGAIGQDIYEATFAQSPYLRANLDIGHWVAGQNISPLPFILKHHERITHLHVKDRKMHDGETMPFGQGDTPIKEVLRTIRDKKWPIIAAIEFDVPLAPGADRMFELKKCLDYCKQALVTRG